MAAVDAEVENQHTHAAYPVEVHFDNADRSQVAGAVILGVEGVAMDRTVVEDQVCNLLIQMVEE